MKRMLGLVVLCLHLMAFSTAWATLQDGVTWLTTHTQPDGSVASSTDLATAVQATGETLRALQDVGIATHPLRDPARQFLLHYPFRNTQYLARLIIARADAGASVAALLDTLLTHQNADGGFGDVPGYGSTALDTAFALEALAAAGEYSAATAGAAVQFVVRQQAVSGGWAVGANAPAVFPSALAMRALWLHRHGNAVDGALQHAHSFLLAQRIGAAWGEPFATALALLAILPRLSDSSPVADSVNALQAAQAANGSWAQDVYSTALAVRALALAARPAPNPDLGTLRGRVIDGDSGLALPGVSIAVSGAATATTVSNADGRWQVNGLLLGTYDISLNLAGYTPLLALTTLPIGGVVDFGTLTLVRSGTATTSTVRGVITEAHTHLPLPGVSVTVNSLSAITGSDGSYQINNVPPGAVTLTATLSGYVSAARSTTLSAGSVVVFSPTLTPSAQPATVAALFGTITAAATGLPLSGVTVSISGSTTASTQTDANGTYRLEPLTTGTLQIEAQRSGFDTVRASTVVTTGRQIAFSPALYATGTTPAGANTSRVSGLVLDASTDAPLAGVRVEATYGTTTSVVTSGSDGRFTVSGITTGEVALRFTLANYVSSALSLLLEPLTTLDLGQVRLRPLTAAALLPDLVVPSMDTAMLSSDPQTLALQGSLRVTVRNQGSSAVTTPFDVLVFVDTNRNDRFDAVVDQQVDLAAGPLLAVGQESTLVIPLAGSVPFRDAPLSVWVDAAQAVVELAENNNVRTTASACEVVPPSGTLEPALEWAWVGSSIAPTSKQVMTMPVVIDLNGDTIPEIVFSTFAGGSYHNGGVLRAVDGRSGQELFAVTAYPIRGAATLAAGDLDGDGHPEILAVSEDAVRLIAFTHDGRFKWLSVRLPGLPANPIVGGDGGAALADLDGDGLVEIMYGNIVLNHNGTLRWNGIYGSGSSYAGALSLVADLDGDGAPEIVAGNTAYRANGQVYWRNTAVPDGLAAVANLDADPFPEIVLVSSSYVFCLTYDGRLKWGPVLLPGGPSIFNVGGAPTIADMDGDGHPDIGVAGGYAYTVFSHTGAIQWSVPIQDTSSSVTGSTVFDFDGDGAAEVLYSDERTLRIYNGRNGQVLWSTPNPNGTAYEYPVVADVDGDGQAEIVVVSNNYAFPGVTGVRVFGDANDSWLPTQPIWNQHTYHITNVQDDGRIPTVETASWASHNTYRLNTFPGRDVRDRADLTAGVLEIVDHGVAQPLSLRVRLGNAGLFTATSIAVAFYQGAPGSGVLLGTVTVPELAGRSMQTVELSGVTLANSADLYAVVDPEDTITECDETNNTVQAPLQSAASLGQLVVSTDALAYGASSPVTLTAIVTNTGSLSATYRVQFRIVDSAGAPIVTLAPLSITDLAGGTSVTLSQVWNTGTILAGTYTLQGVLSSSAGVPLASNTSQLTITSGDPGAALVSLRTTTDRVLYHMTDTVDVDLLVQNLTTNTLLSATQVRVTLNAPSGQVVFTDTRSLGDLAPGAVRQVSIPAALHNAAQGTYTVTGVVLDHNGGILASSQAHLEIRLALSAVLQGTVTVPTATLVVGQSQTCTATLSNRGTVAVHDLAVQHVMVSLDQQQALSSTPTTLSLAPQATHTLVHSLATATLQPGAYACVLQAAVAGTWMTLGYASFQLLPPPNQRPVAHAGAAPTAFVGDVAVFDGSGSTDPDGDPLTYMWTLHSVPEGSTATLAQSDTATPSLAIDRKGPFSLTLVVDDGQEASLPATVTLLVGNRPPVADAGSTHNVETGTTVTLQGSGSFDPDGDLLTYSWSMEWSPDALPDTSVLSDANLAGGDTPTPFFTPDVDGTYTIQLMVHDGEADSAPVWVTVIATTLNVPPNANAGIDQTVLLGQTVHLDGSASADPDAGPQALAFAWSFATVPAGSALQTTDIVHADQALASFLPDVTGAYALTLTVTDGGSSADDTVLITVALDVPPNARAGDDQHVELGNEVVLDGSASDDPDQAPQPLTWQWRFVSVAVGSTLTNADISQAQTANARFTPDVIGSYVLELAVFDGLEWAFDHVLITVRGVNTPPVCTTAVALPSRLWPPDHALIPVRIAGISDADQQPLTVIVTQVRQDEPVNGLGDGDSTPDAAFQSDQLLLRAERSGTGNGRVYHLSFTATDPVGAQCQGTVTICVPHSRQAPCVDGGPLYDALQVTP